MRRLPVPIDNPGNVFIDCIDLVRNTNLKARLTEIRNLVIEAADEFEEKVTTGQLHTVIRETLINGNVTSTELQDVYERMVRKGTLGRKIYDKLIIASPSGICPLCSHREVTQIDHYLPKAEYPRLSVVPINLVPSCSDCNKSKLTKFPQAPEEETLHPYFDNIENDVWLTATVTQSNPASFQFQVTPPDHWDPLLSDRVRFHFNSLSLNKLYSTQAAVELVQINFRLIKIYAVSGSPGVRQYLLEGAESRSHANLNSWQTAMYKAMTADNWFCDGGFRFLPI
ncbi:hypothetical protein EWU23_13360 [Cytophagaceae bacterium 50C-KIRBA]|uniref:HNH endonuclease n=1 Tax=Aquirufa beregesia TaxID=2516556 RepID=A0ABX0F1X1_9BACT|nr:hypothetical protein [Aquirufa beregesia]NGZ45467.1 hypothetical protein [Aquirufa beregesia]